MEKKYYDILFPLFLQHVGKCAFSRGNEPLLNKMFKYFYRYGSVFEHGFMSFAGCRWKKLWLSAFYAIFVTDS